MVDFVRIGFFYICIAFALNLAFFDTPVGIGQVSSFQSPFNNVRSGALSANAQANNSLANPTGTNSGGFINSITSGFGAIVLMLGAAIQLVALLFSLFNLSTIIALLQLPSPLDLVAQLFNVIFLVAGGLFVAGFLSGRQL